MGAYMSKHRSVQSSVKSRENYPKEKFFFGKPIQRWRV